MNDRPADRFPVAGRRVVVVGAARSGIAAARLLAARGAHVALADTRAQIAEADELRGLGVELVLGPHDAAAFGRADLVVLSPGVPAGQEVFEGARRRGVPVIGEMELASRFLEGRLVAVTGTKGKSTTTTLVGRMLSEAGITAIVGGNIGVPLSSQVDTTGPGVTHVVEASSFQLETIETFRPDVAVFLNFSPDHLDRHATVDAYAAAKARIFENQRAGDAAVVNADDARVEALAARGLARRTRFALDAAIDEGVKVVGGEVSWIADGVREPLVPLSSVRLIGRHLLADVLAASAVARLCGADAAAMTRAVEGFGGLEHALERVAWVGQVQFVNDSKATNIESARQAIESFESGLVVILGGRFKGGDFGVLAAPLERRARAVVAIGEAAGLVRDALRGVLPVLEAGTMAEAVAAAFAAARPSGTVLLAPACASFDMFRDYAERGRVFKEEVARLAASLRHV